MNNILRVFLSLALVACGRNYAAAEHAQQNNLKDLYKRVQTLAAKTGNNYTPVLTELVQKRLQLSDDVEAETAVHFLHRFVASEQEFIAAFRVVNRSHAAIGGRASLKQLLHEGRCAELVSEIQTFTQKQGVAVALVLEYLVQYMLPDAKELRLAIDFLTPFIGSEEELVPALHIIIRTHTSKEARIPFKQLLHEKRYEELVQAIGNFIQQENIPLGFVIEYLFASNPYMETICDKDGNVLLSGLRHEVIESDLGALKELDTYASKKLRSLIKHYHTFASKPSDADISAFARTIAQNAFFDNVITQYRTKSENLLHELHVQKAARDEQEQKRKQQIALKLQKQKELETLRARIIKTYEGFSANIVTHAAQSNTERIYSAIQQFVKPYMRVPELYPELEVLVILAMKEAMTKTLQANGLIGQLSILNQLTDRCPDELFFKRLSEALQEICSSVLTRLIKHEQKESTKLATVIKHDERLIVRRLEEFLYGAKEQMNKNLPELFHNAQQDIMNRRESKIRKHFVEKAQRKNTKGASNTGNLYHLPLSFIRFMQDCPETKETYKGTPRLVKRKSGYIYDTKAGSKNTILLPIVWSATLGLRDKSIYHFGIDTNKGVDSGKRGADRYSSFDLTASLDIRQNKKISAWLKNIADSATYKENFIGIEYCREEKLLAVWCKEPGLENKLIVMDDVTPAQWERIRNISYRTEATPAFASSSQAASSGY